MYIWPFSYVSNDWRFWKYDEVQEIKQAELELGDDKKLSKQWKNYL